MATFILDGYNVIHAVPELAKHLDRSLEAAREALATFCQSYLARRGDISRLYIVFDGADAGESARVERGNVTILFTQRQEEADDRILELIRANQRRTPFIIVSNDVYIFNNARAHGARVMPVRDFFSQASARRPSNLKPAESEAPPLTTPQMQRITEEYRQLLEGRRAKPTKE